MANERILIIEDENIVAMDIKNSLLSLGYTVCGIISSGEDAVNIVAETHPDLVLIDILLKDEMDGIQAAEQLQNNFKIPVVYLTAFADEDTLKRAKITEPYGYILKPFEERELHTTIEMALYKHKMESKLKDSEQWLSTILKSIGDAVIATNKKGLVTFMNPIAELLTGWKKEDAIDKNLMEVFNIIDEKTRILPENIVDRVLKDSVIVALTDHSILIGRNGKEIPIDDSAAPIKDDKGNITGVVIIFRDITERKQAEEALQKAHNELELRVEERTTELSKANTFLKEQIIERQKAEEALRQSEERYRRLIENAKEAIFTLSPEGTFTSFNPAFEQITGWVRADCFGKHLSQIIHPDDINTAKEIFQHIMTGEIAPVFELRIISKSGTNLIGEFTMAPLKQNEEVIAVLGIARDITERKKMEEELSNARRLESIGTLAGGIAHDFNNILTAILGNVSLAKMIVNPDDKIYQKLEKAEKASFRAKHLTKQLLTFARGGAPVKRMSSIAELIKDSADFALSGSNVKCEFYIPSNLWKVEIDPGQMNQVIHNLIINADQAMPTGGVIKIVAKNVILNANHHLPLENGEYIKISIKDQGIGIQEEHLQKIFDPYFTTKVKGSGLGLATSYSIIKNHGGYIEVESEENVGTTINIYLPAFLEVTVTKKKIEKLISTGKGMILIMDDEKLVRDVTGEMLKDLGYKVEFAKDGVEALELYKQSKMLGAPFNAVLMDLTIPGGLGGKETIEELLNIDANAKVIVSSGYFDDPILANYKQYGFCGVVAKPYNILELSEVLHNILNET